MQSTLGLEPPVEIALHVRAQHAEGPLWDGDSGRLWWVDIAGRRVHCFDPRSGADSSWPVAGEPGGVVLDGDGNPIVATPEGLCALDRESGALELLVPVEGDRPENRANDIKVDAHGRAWVGSMALDKRRAGGALYRVDGHEVARVVGDLTISNGPAFDETARRMYLADSGAGTVDVFDYDPDSGRLGARRRFLEFHDVWPDGMTVDAEGMLWLALGRGWAVHRYSRAGVLRETVDLPTSNPTSVTFGGQDGGDLYITTSWTDLDAGGRATQLLAGALFRCRPGVTGRPSPRFRRAQ